PYGAINDTVRSNVPLTIVQWNVDPEDWLAKKTTQQVIQDIQAHAKPGAVIIMHDTHQRTLEALDPTLASLEPSYQFVTISDLLYLAPGQSGTYYGR
ncbi:MAG TPA: hypothetical protein VLF43_02325, partial [Candidatus Saccharimonadales bacterium]|nr:hypothetical protein [Candidatus Saccharimonadales bacterium]